MLRFVGSVLGVCVLLVCSSFQETYAKKWGIVVGGVSSEMKAEHHEMARSVILMSMGLKKKGFDVTTFFGHGREKASSWWPSFGEQTWKADREQHAGDYVYLEQKGIARQDSTLSNIKARMAKIAKTAKAGDEVVVDINAHGSNDCITIKRNKSAADERECHHTIWLYKDDGRGTEAATRELLPELLALEKKGVQLTILLDSCHGGQAVLDLASLKRACIMASSSPGSVSYGCFDTDPPGSLDYTSVAETVAYQFYRDVIPEVENDPYFKGQKCFEQIKAYVEAHAISGRTLDEAFFKARQWDQAFQEPVVNGLSRPEVLFGKAIQEHGVPGLETGPICVENVKALFEPFLSSIANREIQKKFEGFLSVIGRYNETIAVQKAVIAEMSGMKNAIEAKSGTARDGRKEEDAKIERLRKAQKDGNDLARAAIKEERGLIQMIRELKPELMTSSTCREVTL